MLRVGFIGTGMISHENVRGYLGNPDTQIVAVASIHEAEARNWLARYCLDKAVFYADYRQMIQEQQLDIVEILTPHHLHAEHAIAAAEAQVGGISLQKPMAPTLEECDRIIAACRQHGVRLKIYDNFLFYPPYVKAKELIQQGLIGAPVSIRVNTMTGIKPGAQLPWCFNPTSWRANLDQSGMGPLLGDDGFHKFSLARWFMERDVERIGAWIDEETPLDAPAYVRMKFKRQPSDPPKYAQIDFSYSAQMALPCDFWLDDFVEIVGQGGVMWINQCSAAGNRDMFRGNEMSQSPVFPPIAVFVNGKVSTYLSEIDSSQRNWSHSFVASTRHFIEVMKHGGKPVCTGEDGKEIGRYIIAAYVSAQQHRDIELSEITTQAEHQKKIQITNNFCNP